MYGVYGGITEANQFMRTILHICVFDFDDVFVFRLLRYFDQSLIAQDLTFEQVNGLCLYVKLLFNF